MTTRGVGTKVEPAVKRVLIQVLGNRRLTPSRGAYYTGVVTDVERARNGGESVEGPAGVAYSRFLV